MNRYYLSYAILFLLLCMVATHAFAAYDIALQNADGKTIYYNLNVDDKVASVAHPHSINAIGVTYNHYSGTIAIPEKIVFEGDEYSVTSIGDLAFNGCSNLTEVTIPNSVKHIGVNAFYGCSGLQSVTIPEGVIRIEKFTFNKCEGLTEITIPNNVTSIGWGAFAGCSNLTSLTIPNSVKTIGESAFVGCVGLTSVDIPNSVTRIEYGAFIKCGLTSITIPDGVTSIAGETFGNCAGLTSVSIPNNVTAIDKLAFQNCSELTFVKIPKGVTNIGQKAFAGCSKLTEVYCYAKTIPTTSGDAFDDSNVQSVTLYVPEGCISKYKAKAPWNRFEKFSEIPNFALTYMVDGVAYKSYKEEEGNSISPEPAPTKEGYTFSGWSEIPVTMPAQDVTVTGTFVKDSREKCALPTISVENGKVIFGCETEGVTYHYDIVSLGSVSGDGNNVELLNSYKVTVYATKDDYIDSDSVTAEIELAGGVKGDVNNDGVVNVADHVKLSEIIMNQNK